MTDRLGLIPLGPLEWVINSSPSVGGLKMLFLSPLLPILMRLLVEFRYVRISDEFVAFKCDVFFSVIFANALALVNTIPGGIIIHRSSGWVALQIVILVGCVAMCVVHYRLQAPYYSRAQRLSPSALYHTVVVYVMIGYPLITVGGIALIAAPWSVLYVQARLVMLAAFGIWAWAVAYDYKYLYNRDGVLRHDIVHVSNGWPWQHKYNRYHWLWWHNRAKAEYIALWRRAARLARLG